MGKQAQRGMGREGWWGERTGCIDPQGRMGRDSKWAWASGP